MLNHFVDIVNVTVTVCWKLSSITWDSCATELEMSGQVVIVRTEQML